MSAQWKKVPQWSILVGGLFFLALGTFEIFEASGIGSPVFWSGVSVVLGGCLYLLVFTFYLHSSFRATKWGKPSVIKTAFLSVYGIVALVSLTLLLVEMTRALRYFYVGAVWTWCFGVGGVSLGLADAIGVRIARERPVSKSDSSLRAFHHSVGASFADDSVARSETLDSSSPSNEPWCQTSTDEGTLPGMSVSDSYADETNDTLLQQHSGKQAS